jgi:predicted outer membrane protein
MMSNYPLAVGRAAWSLEYASKMAVGSSQAVDEEARAEVEVLKSRLEKTTQLTKKIQASLGRLEASGKTLQDAVGPIYGKTQELQVVGSSTYARIDLRDSNLTMYRYRWYPCSP